MKKILFLAFSLSYIDVYAEQLIDTSIAISTDLPAFLRNGDYIEIETTITSSSNYSGQISLQLFNAYTNTSVDGWFTSIFPVQHFSTSSNEKAIIYFPITVPDSFTASVQLKIIELSNVNQQPIKAILPILHKINDLNPFPKSMISITKTVFKKINGLDSLLPVNSFDELFIGDTIGIRLEFSSKIQYPISIRDALPATLKLIKSENTFKEYVGYLEFSLPKRSTENKVIEYSCIVTHAGKFNFGTSSIKINNKEYSLSNPEVIRVSNKN